MKKKIFILFFVLITVMLLTVIFNNHKNNDVFNNKVNGKLIKKDLLTMNLEQTAGAGDYKSVTQSEWPMEGYIFNAELSKCENGGELSWDNAKKVVLMSGNVSDKCYVYFNVARYDQECNDNTLSCYIAKKYGNLNSSSIYYHDASLKNGANDLSYRYAGSSSDVNNYICLGSDAATCPDANLFRIIGVFGDQTKVIRAKSVGDKQWHTSNDNTWSSSSLNTYLNGEYLTGLGTLADKIATTTWKVGGNAETNIINVVPMVAYANEIKNPDAINSNDNATTYDAKVGLMYVSDYSFAACPEAWTLMINSYDNAIALSSNWMYMGLYEWTISRDSSSNYISFNIDKTGAVMRSGCGFNYAIRVTFNLNSSVTYVSGTGTQSDPIRIN